MPRRDLARRAPPSQAIAADATSPAGSFNGEIVWSTAENDYLRWSSGAWRQVPRLAVAADGTPAAIGTAASLGASKAAAPLLHVHPHGNLPGGALHANADNTNAGFQTAAHYQITQSLGLGVAVSAGVADTGKVPKLNTNGQLDLSFVQFANAGQHGLMSLNYAAKLDGVETNADVSPPVSTQAAVPLSPATPALIPGGTGQVADAGHVHPVSYASETQEGIVQASDFASFANMRLPPDGMVNRQWVPNAGATTYDDRGWGVTVWGTPTAQAVANAASQRFARIRYATATTTNAGAGVSGALNVQRNASAVPLIGGFRFTARFRVVTMATTNQWFFIGLYNAGTWTGATLPTAIPNNMGFFIRNNTISFITVPATAASFVSANVSAATVSPALLANGMEVYITSLESNPNTIYYGMRQIDTAGGWAAGGSATTGLIAQGLPLGPMCAMSASSNLVAVVSELGVMTLQSRY